MVGRRLQRFERRRLEATLSKVDFLADVANADVQTDILASSKSSGQAQDSLLGANEHAHRQEPCQDYPRRVFALPASRADSPSERPLFQPTLTLGARLLSSSPTCQLASEQMAAPPSYDDVVAPPKPVDRASVLSGVEARLSSNPVPSSSRSDTEDQSVRLAFLRIIDTQILDRNPRKVALESLETLVKVLENARKEGPQEERQKYRTLKLTNPLVKRTVVDVHGASFQLSCMIRLLI